MSIYVFGYGALLNLKTIKEIESTKKICPVMVNGLKRALNVKGKKQLVFGVKNVKTSNCNGILFKVNETELARLQQREKLYTMKTLAKEQINFAYGKCLSLKPADQIICFYPKASLTKKELLDEERPISAYLRNCKAGARAIGDTFFQDFQYD